MINAAKVILWGTTIGYMHIDENKSTVAFEYDADFVDSGIELSPLVMPLSNAVYEFPSLAGTSFYGAPGLVADSLPDKFGNKIIERWLAEEGKSISEFNVIDRLCYTGKRGMGALEYEPDYDYSSNIIKKIQIDKMVSFASEVLSRFENKRTSIKNDVGYAQLVKLGTSAGGARAKALIALNEKTGEIKSGLIDPEDDFDYWIIKFDGVSKNGDYDLDDKPEYTLIEYAYYLMAKDAGININECQLYNENGRNHFMTKRFDRADGKKIHMQTLGALTHTDYNIPGLMSYEQAAFYMKKMGLYQSEVEEFFRRMVFNVFLVNQDDHVKNTSFLMSKKGEWHLAPAYDLTFAYNTENHWLKAHQMLVNGKSTGITKDDLVIAGERMGISKRKCNTIISDVEAVSMKSKDYFDSQGINAKTIKEMQKVICH